MPLIYNLLLALLIELTSVTVYASGRKLSFSLDEQKTIITEFANLDKFAGIRKVRFNLDEHETIITEYTKVNKVLDYKELPNSRGVSSLTNFEHIPSESLDEISLPLISIATPFFPDIVRSNVSLSASSVVNHIHNNRDFRRDNLNNTIADSQYVLISEYKDEYMKSSTNLVELDNNLHIKSLKELAPDEIQNIPEIAEEIMYNAIIYELPTSYISTLTNISNINNLIDIRTLNPVFGISAGTESNNYGIWIKGASTFTKQSMLMEVDAFKAYSRGVLIGFDSLVTDTALIGVAYGRNLGTTNFDKGLSTEKTDTHSLSIYSGSCEHKVNFLYSLTGATILVKNTRDMFYDNKIVESKHTGNAAAIQVSAFNSYHHTNLLILPKLSFRYDIIDFKPFKENGVLISRNVTRRFSTIPSIGIGSEIIAGKSILIPMLHYDLIIPTFQNNKKSHITILHNQQIISCDKKLKLAPTHNIGAKIEWINSSLKLQLTADRFIGKKSHSHSFTLGLNYRF